MELSWSLTRICINTLIAFISLKKEEGRCTLVYYLKSHCFILLVKKLNLKYEKCCLRKDPRNLTLETQLYNMYWHQISFSCLHGGIVSIQPIVWTLKWLENNIVVVTLHSKVHLNLSSTLLIYYETLKTFNGPWLLNCTAL